MNQNLKKLFESGGFGFRYNYELFTRSCRAGEATRKKIIKEDLVYG